MAIDAGPEDPLTLAAAAHARVEVDAGEALGMAERALSCARRDRHAEAEVAALHALGFARHELGDDRAVRTLRAAVRVGERHGLVRRVALVRRPLAVYLAYRGEIGPALTELDAACAVLDDLELARSEVFRIAVLGLAGRAPTRLESSDRALEILRREGDAIWEARLLKNRGVLLAERGDADAAEPDLTRARDLYASLGATESALGAEYELARVALTRGDLPGCLARLDAIDAADVSALHNSALELLRAKALVAGRLMAEARHALDAAQEIWRRAGIEDPEGRLEVVRLTLLAGDPAAARVLSERARRSFAASRRPVYSARGVGLALAASIQAGTLRRSALRSARRASATLAAAGWADEAISVQLAVARAATELGSTVIARRELAACAELRAHGPLADRIEVRHIDALLCVAGGDPAGAQRAVRGALRLLETHRAALGASDLRATASAIGVELAQLGVRLALAGSDTHAVLRSAERLRAGALRLPPVTPPDNPELREAATALRRVSAEILRGAGTAGSARALRARQSALEASIRRLSRHSPGVSGPTSRVPTRKELARRLGERALVELIELDGALTAVVLAGNRLSRCDLGPLAPVDDELDWLRFGLTRLAPGGHPPAQRAALLAGARASAAAIDRRLILPIAQSIGDRPLVIVPTGSLHAVPWSMLPTIGGRPVVVAPSATTWLTLQSRPARPAGATVLVAGPRLRHATAELAAVATCHPAAVVLSGRRATVAAVMAALDGARIAHLACHGRLRADSPLFSSLELADGPLNAYELQRLRHAPELIVLSACDLAVSGAHPGDELLGFASALIGMGARTVLASVVAVPDAAAKRLMLAMHRHLVAGDGPALALARAQRALRPRESALAGFVCLGAG
ncbi:MAG TPA: CHAT domain-containing protein [Solirubrobacteraceae bacterium]|nr:CHAT domain-containing protein [Solirubrobacteraceae bacterium]